MPKLLVQLTAGFFILYGLAFGFAPIAMFLLVTDSQLETSSALIDLRATYGGLSVAVGCLLFILSKHNKTLRLSLLATGTVLLLMAAGRILGMVFDGYANQIMYLYLILELLAGGVAMMFWKSHHEKF